MIVALGDDLPTVVRCAQTCKRHYALAMDAIVWRHLYESRFGPPLHRRFLDVGKTWRWLYEAQARVTDGDTRGPQTGAMLIVVGFAQWIYWGDVVDGTPEGYGLALPLPQTRTRCPARVPDDSVTCQQQGHYEGYWHDGKRHGYGVEVTGDGRSYDGQWRPASITAMGSTRTRANLCTKAPGMQATGAVMDQLLIRTVIATRAIGTPTNHTVTASTPGSVGPPTMAPGDMMRAMATGRS
ncbi:morn repeat incomplete domain containing protein [Pandoravirus celtis]|uniref:Morn repeat incomplete domain containing protein n=1 Tax=Pandoravirus celtis TaxID=2568002 RepID=A0A4D6EJX0_9VIRU|nr:morn repeat incomplete domain containing protein [Pandoravirus celtis]